MTKVTWEQFIIGVVIIGSIFLISYLVTKYTRYGGGGDYGTGGDNSGFDGFDF
ncbi:hypothetical protein [Abyssalbus ytuae]|uniref:Uncharacterized protein n=1 Tax=Abyssalbus ytuae TaxID=2926907 RepID=A0A9E6ZMU3_9FLAO|nr:hypothetical protein [Abyssalbus ytuae]UOB18779.1 hypothetical protein MQE35_05665 [Abyssalbus ytuae]